MRYRRILYGCLHLVWGAYQIRLGLPLPLLRGGRLTEVEFFGNSHSDLDLLASYQEFQRQLETALRTAHDQDTWFIRFPSRA